MALIAYLVENFPFLFYFLVFFSCVLVILVDFLLLLLCVKIFKSLK